jgi:ComF family protein
MHKIKGHLNAGWAAVNRTLGFPIDDWLKKLHWSGLPPTCMLCGAPGAAERDLCAACRADLPLNHTPCMQCGSPLAATAVDVICGSCLQSPPPFEQAFVPLLYEPPVDFLIRTLKYRGQLPAGRLLGEWLAEGLENRAGPWPECIIPVPLHPSRLRMRGFNQALELARPIERRWGIPVTVNAVRRIRPTVPQVQLSFEKRLSNLQGAFAVGQPLSFRSAAVLDDVVTTGSTVREVAQVLREAGVEQIEVWACARTRG